MSLYRPLLTSPAGDESTENTLRQSHLCRCEYSPQKRVLVEFVCASEVTAVLVNTTLPSAATSTHCHSPTSSILSSYLYHATYLTIKQILLPTTLHVLLELYSTLYSFVSSSTMTLPAIKPKGKLPINMILILIILLLKAAPATAFFRHLCHGQLAVARIDPLMSFGEASQHVHTAHGASGMC